MNSRGDALAGSSLLIEVDDVGLGKDATAPRESCGRLGLGRDLRELLDGAIVEALAHMFQERAGTSGALVAEVTLLNAESACQLIGRQGQESLGFHPHLDDGTHVRVPGAAGSSESDRLVERFDSQGLAKRATGSARGPQADPGRRSAVA